MYYRDTEILFPMRVAPNLRDLRGPIWGKLVDRAMCSPDASAEQLAFSLVMIRQCGCLTCHPNNYRAMRGCTICSMQAVRRFRCEDLELVTLVDDARKEIEPFAHPAG